MNYKSKLAILGLVSKIFAAKFSVVSFSGECSLSLNGQALPMTASQESSKVFQLETDAAANAKYKYVCGGKEEQFERTLVGDNTHNELFGRPLTVSELYELYLPDSQPWNRGIGRTEVFDPTYVPTVIVDTSRSFFESTGTPTFKKLTFVLKDSIKTFESAKVVESKNDEQDKFQFEVNLPDGADLYGRTNFKFRPSSEDPNFIRQILYSDLAHAVGNPTHESIAVRVYMEDGTEVGLYVLQENVASESFARATFYKDGSAFDASKSKLYDCSTGADFDPNSDLGSFQPVGGPDNKIELAEMIANLAALDVTNADAVKAFSENWFDLDTLLKALALEYLAGHWDSYWYFTTNFGFFHPGEEVAGEEYNHTKYKFYFIDQDFDQTWSVGDVPEDFPKKSYKEYVTNKSWKGDHVHLLISQLLGCNGQQSCVTKDMFENYLKSIVQHVYNPVALGERIKGYRTRLDDEIKWDYGLKRLHTGTYATATGPTREPYYHFTYDDYNNAFEYGVISYYGLNQWINEITNTVCNEFGIQYDQTPIVPKDSKNPAAGGSPSNLGNSSSGAISNKANVALAVIATILSVVLFH